MLVKNRETYNLWKEKMHPAKNAKKTSFFEFYMNFETCFLVFKEFGECPARLSDEPRQ